MQLPVEPKRGHALSQSTRTALGVLALAVIAAACSPLVVKPHPPTTAQVAPATHKLGLLPTVDKRRSDRAGGGIDVFGIPDLLVRTDVSLASHLDELATQSMVKQGLTVVEGDGEVPSVQLTILAISLRRDPGVVLAHYTGTAELLVRVQMNGRARELPVSGRAEREASGVRALEKAVFNELLTDTLHAAATEAAAAIATMLRDDPPQILD